jgi:hypothetical protein
MSQVGIGIRPPKKRALGIVEANVLYHSLTGTISNASPHDLHSIPWNCDIGFQLSVNTNPEAAPP